jgi:hypothetical protein
VCSSKTVKVEIIYESLLIAAIQIGIEFSHLHFKTQTSDNYKWHSINRLLDAIFPVSTNCQSLTSGNFWKRCYFFTLWCTPPLMHQYPKTHVRCDLVESIFKQSRVRLNVIYNPWSNSSCWHRYLKSLHYRSFHRAAISSNVWMDNPCAHTAGPQLQRFLCTFSSCLITFNELKPPQKNHNNVTISLTYRQSVLFSLQIPISS